MLYKYIGIQQNFVILKIYMVLEPLSFLGEFSPSQH